MTCFECAATAYHLHHVVPRSRGGTKTVALCVACHGLAHHYSMSHPGLTKEALAAKRTRGERVGQVPYGSRVSSDGVHLEEHPEEAPVVELVGELHAAGVSTRAIAARLDAEGAPCRGVRWHRSLVRRLLLREDAP
jgi:hypothetical protein